MGDLSLSIDSPGPVLITGAAGFIGAHLCEYFLGKSRVIAVIRSAGPSWRMEYLKWLPAVAGRFEIAEVDLANRQRVRELLQSTQPAVILNCAAYGAYSSQTEADRIYQVNFESLRTLLEEARQIAGLKAFIQTGSSSEYGLNCSGPLETDPTLPDSHYAVSKVAATQLVQFYGMKYNLPAWTFRIYSVYGPLEDASRLIPKSLLKGMAGQLPPLTKPTNSRDFIYIDDLCQAFERAIHRSQLLVPGGVYNIGSGYKTTLQELVDLLKTQFSIQDSPSWGSMADRSWDHSDWYAHTEKAQRELKWVAQTSLSEGLQRTVDWFRGNPQWLEKSTRNAVMDHQ